MKKYVIFIVCLISSIMVFGQDETKQINVEVDEVKVTPPKFTGIENATASSNTGESALINNYLIKNLVCPKGAVECEKEGTEVIEFTVNPDGKLSNFKVINSVCSEVDEELIRLLRSTNGMWLPGYNNGEPTAMEREVSLMIGSYKPDEIASHFVNKAEKLFEMGSLSFCVDQKPKKALRYYDKGLRYMPNDKSLLLLRGFCNYEIGKTEKAKRDWERIQTLGGTNGVYFDELVEMKGYEEMKKILAKQ